LKFYLDEDMSHRVAAALRAKGVEALSSHEAGNDGLTDGEQLEFTASRGLVLVTYNRRDFLALAARWFSESRAFPGIVLLLESRFPRHDVGRVARALADFAPTAAGRIEGTVTFLPAGR
jgi:predicted nuclease of predicted toxin-antitoxin system